MRRQKKERRVLLLRNSTCLSLAFKDGTSDIRVRFPPVVGRFDQLLNIRCCLVLKVPNLPARRDIRSSCGIGMKVDSKQPIFADIDLTRGLRGCMQNFFRRQLTVSHHGQAQATQVVGFQQSCVVVEFVPGSLSYFYLRFRRRNCHLPSVVRRAGICVPPFQLK